MAMTSFKFSEDLGNTRFYCGLDVHKHQLAVAIYGKDESGHELVKCETFGTDPKSLDAFFSFTSRFRPASYGMEATNVYHHNVALLLDKMATIVDWTYDIVVFNPSDASGIPGYHKHDKYDATQIAKFLAAGLLKAGRAVNVILEDLRAVFRMAARLEQDRTALKNRIKKTLDRAGIRPTKLDLNTQWVIELLNALVEHEGTLGELLDATNDNSRFSKSNVTSIRRNTPIFEPFLDISLTPGQRAIVNQDLVELDFKTARITLLAVEIDRIIASRPGLRQSIMNLASIPGLTPFSAAWLISEVGPITRYPTHRKFTAYCGCCERTVKSAMTTYSAHMLRRSNKHVRYILYNAARVLCHAVKRESVLKQYATRIYKKKRVKAPAVAYCTIATKLSRIIYAMLRDGTGFNPDLARNHNMPAGVEQGLFTVSDKRKLRNSLKALKRVKAMTSEGLLPERVAYFADALEKALKDN